MTKYITKPTAEDWYEQPMPPLPHPIVYSPEPTFTGLCDVDGNPIYRTPNPIGYVRPK